MLKCIIHVGMPKTGTSSIQQTLSRGLRDPRFRLISRDAYLGNHAVDALFLKQPESRATLVRAGLTGRRLAGFQAWCITHFGSQLDAARSAGWVPIVSAEHAFSLSSHELDDLRRFFEGRGFECQIILCLRPPLDLAESGFQQGIKSALSDWNGLRHRSMAGFSYRERISTFDAVFGRSRVDTYAFDPAAFPNRCAVAEFCRRIGAEVRMSQIHRVNEALNTQVVRCLYAYNRFGPQQRSGWRARIRQAILLRQLADLQGPRFVLHPDAVSESLERFNQDRPWIDERLGQRLPLSHVIRSPGEGVRCEEDLLDFDAGVVRWLAAKTGRRLLKPGRGEALARSVTAELKCLVGRPSGRAVMEELADRGKHYTNRLRQVIVERTDRARAIFAIPGRVGAKPGVGPGTLRRSPPNEPGEPE